MTLVLDVIHISRDMSAERAEQYASYRATCTVGTEALSLSTEGDRMDGGIKIVCGLSR